MILDQSTVNTDLSKKQFKKIIKRIFKNPSVFNLEEKTESDVMTASKDFGGCTLEFYVDKPTGKSPIYLTFYTKGKEGNETYSLSVRGSPMDITLGDNAFQTDTKKCWQESIINLTFLPLKIIKKHLSLKNTFRLQSIQLATYSKPFNSIERNLAIKTLGEVLSYSGFNTYQYVSNVKVLPPCGHKNWSSFALTKYYTGKTKNKLAKSHLSLYFKEVERDERKGIFYQSKQLEFLQNRVRIDITLHPQSLKSLMSLTTNNITKSDLKTWLQGFENEKDFRQTVVFHVLEEDFKLKTILFSNTTKNKGYKKFLPWFAKHVKLPVNEIKKILEGYGKQQKQIPFLKSKFNINMNRCNANSKRDFGVNLDISFGIGEYYKNIYQENAKDIQYSDRPRPSTAMHKLYQNLFDYQEIPKVKNLDHIKK